ncbi:Crp/Fnr family transcriptional regulator [Wenjunlia vitaminophila]|uniref:Crp/Fnr family transcriptional regulator n=1 Tax=Wenjunlia vitaminophila TaxID=76728 RepID=A0A0T6LWN6_WENVI|nr:ThuA domain-containing protein [Wenjunlia vitaminophila]KRV50567.1 Crp/Fnr family transcriptional regulator [Wenjunlia vitaminophila]
MRPPSVLVFTRTNGYRHDSIPDGVAAFRALGAEHGFSVRHTEDPDAFTDDLGTVRAVVFLSTMREVLTPEARDALRGYMAAGGGFVGVHSAAGTELHWPYFGELIGARFTHHPPLQPGVVVVEDHDHPATRHLGDTWPLVDEWYEFQDNPRGRVRVLLRVDEDSYGSGTMGADHPLAWSRELDGGGRSFFTSLGHTREIYADPDFRRHLLGGLRYVARLGGPSGSGTAG